MNRRAFLQRIAAVAAVPAPWPNAMPLVTPTTAKRSNLLTVDEVNAAVRSLRSDANLPDPYESYRRAMATQATALEWMDRMYPLYLITPDGTMRRIDSPVSRFRLSPEDDLRDPMYDQPYGSRPPEGRAWDIEVKGVKYTLHKPNRVHYYVDNPDPISTQPA